MTLHFIMDKVINNQMAKKSHSRHSHWSLCQTRVTRVLRWLMPMGSLCPCRAEEGHYLWNEWLYYISQLKMCGLVVQRCLQNKQADNRLAHSLLGCSHLHLNPKCWVIPPCLSHCEKGTDLPLTAGTPQHSEVGWGHWGADTVAAQLPWVATVSSSMASCKLDTQVSQETERKRNLQRISTYFKWFS